ncbi:Ig-like domain-containing protein [Pseudoalteromonas spongiae]|uniref:Ig-like domain-containing protein n=1 Tax=Pseudoalteromonas spongiae TaxID=298657 RepID=A0ABU8END5_9GAMM
MRKFNYIMKPFVLGIMALCSFNAISASVVPVFSPNTIGADSNSKLTLTLTNSSGTSERNLSFSASLPSNVVLSTPSISTTTCGASAVLSATDGGNSFSLSNGELANGASCQVTVMTTSSVVGTHTFNMPSIVIGSASSSPAATDLIIATDRPSISFSLDKSTAVVGENIRATLTFDNSLVSDLFVNLSADFQLPNGLTVSDFPDTSNDCTAFSAGTVSSPGDESFSVSALSVAANSTCSVSQNLKASKPYSGNIVSSSIIGFAGGFTSKELGFVADQIAISRPALSMNVAAPISPGESSQLQFTLINYERSQSASDIDFSVDLSATSIAGITWSATELTNVCGNGDLSGNNSGVITFSNGSLSAEESCTFSVDIHIPDASTPGAYTLNSSTVYVDGFDKGTAKADLIVVGAPVAELRFTQSGSPVSSVAAGDTVGIEFTFTDTSNSSVTDLQAILELTGPLPFPISATLPPTPNPACGAGSSVSLISLGTERQGLSLSGGSLSANSSCTFTVDIAIPDGLETSVLNYTMTSASATVSSESVLINLPSFSLNVVGAPSLNMEMPKGVLGGELSNAVFTLSHRDISPASATDISFTLDLESVLTGLTAANLPLTDICGVGSSVTGSVGDSQITVTGAQLAPDSSCNFNVALNIPSNATPGEFNATTSAVTANVGSLSVVGNAASSELVVTGLEGTLEFLSSAIPGGTVTARYTFNNVGPTDITNMFFSQLLSDIVSGTNYSGGTVNDLCGTGSSLSGTTNLVFTGGNISSGQSCTFDIEYNIPAAAAIGDYAARTGSVSYNVGSAVVTSPLLALLSIDTPIQVINEFTELSVKDSDTAILEYTLTNTGSAPLTNIAFTDNFASALSGATAVITSVNQCNGALSGTSTLSFSGGSIAVGESCTISVGVAVPDVSSQVILTTTSSTISADSNSLAVTADGVSASITVVDSALDIVTSIGSPSASKTNTGPILFPVSFTNADQVNLSSSGVLLTQTGTASASINVVDGNTSTPTVELFNIVGDGSLAIKIGQGVARNSAGNSIETPLSQVVSIDNIKPSITLSASQNGNTLNNLTPFVVNINFDSDIDALALVKSDFTLVNATASDFTINDGNNADITFTPLADGPVSISLPVNKIVDSAGNGNDAQSVGFTSDNTKPTLTITSASEFVSGAFVANIEFSEIVFNFDVNDIVTSNATLSGFTGSGSSYSVLVTPVAQGDVTLDVAADLAQDAAMNGNQVATQFNVSYDTSAPTVSITAPTVLQNSTFSVDIAFSENVIGFDISDINVTNASLSNLISTSSNYSVDVTPLSDGLVTLNIAESAATDFSGNGNTASNSVSVTADVSRPTVLLTTKDDVVVGLFDITAEFSESVSGLDVSDIDVTNASVVGITAITNSLYGIQLRPNAGGLISVRVTDGAVLDNGNNSNLASNLLEITYVDDRVDVQLSAPERVNTAFELTIDFNGAVTGFESSDISVTNGRLSDFKTLSNSRYSVTVTGVEQGEIILAVPQNVAFDEFGIGNLASLPITVLYDNSVPVPQGFTPENDGEAISIYTQFSVVFSEDVSLANGDITLVNTSDNSTFIASHKAVNGDVLEFTFNTNLAVQTQYQVILEAGLVEDAFGNRSDVFSNWFFVTGNSAPIANDDSVIVKEDNAIVINLLVNDSDAEGELDPTSIEFTQPNNGTVSINSDGNVVYTPKPNFNGDDAFNYSVADSAGVRSNLASVAITIESINDTPQFDSVAITEVIVGTNYQYDVVVSDVDNESLTVKALVKPEWLSFENLVLFGSPSNQDIGQSFDIILEVSDGELVTEQVFKIAVVESETSSLAITQAVDVTSIIANSAFVLSVDLSNSSEQAVNFDSLTVELQGVQITEVPETCSVDSLVVECKLLTPIAAKSTETFKYTLLAGEAGEFVSEAQLKFNENSLKQSTFAKVIVDESIDEVGLPIDITGVNNFALGDMNNDGTLDLIFAGNKTSAIYINLGKGKFQLGAEILSSENIFDVAISDFNGDGLNDIAFASDSNFGSGIWFNSGDLTPSSVQVVSRNTSKAVFVFDINNDAQNDLVLLDDSQVGFSVFTQPFTPVSSQIKRDGKASLSSEQQLNDLASADLNGDGLIDLVLAISNEQLQVWMQSPQGEYTKKELSFNDATKVQVIDLYDDGVVDIVALNEQGVFVFDSETGLKEQLSSVAFIDMQFLDIVGDNQAELLLLSASGDTTYFTLTNNGYELSKSVVITENAIQLAVADIDGDQDKDIITSSSNGSSEIRYNQGNGRFGLQTTDLRLTSSDSTFSGQQGDSVDFIFELSNQGLAEVSDIQLALSSTGISIDSITSEFLVCEQTAEGYVCRGATLFDVGNTETIQISVKLESVGVGSLSAELSSERVDDDLSNNSSDIMFTVTSKPVVVEPVKKKSSGSLFGLLILLIALQLIRLQSIRPGKY